VTTFEDGILLNTLQASSMLPQFFCTSMQCLFQILQFWKLIRCHKQLPNCVCLQ
jgi:hypothetical protein